MDFPGSDPRTAPLTIAYTFLAGANPAIAEATRSGPAADFTDPNNGSITFAVGDAMVVPVTIVDDSATEPAEEFRFRVTGITGAQTVGNAAQIIGQNATITIIASDNYPAERTVTVTGPATLAETDSDFTSGNYTITLSGAAFASNTTVGWAIVHGSTDTLDFGVGVGASRSGSVMFTPADADGATKTFTFTVGGDNLNEAAETFTIRLTIENNAGATAYGPRPTVTITDDDTITATLSGGGGSVAEGAAASLTVTLSGATHTADVVFNYNTDDAAGSLTLAPGTNSGTLTITATDDALSEDAETFTVDTSSLTATTAGMVTIAAPQMFTITASDDITVTIAAASTTANTGGSANFTVTMSNASMAAVTVTYDTSGVVTATGETITIPAGQTSGSIAVAIPATAVAEGEEGMLTVTLTDATAATGGGTATLGATASATVTVTSDNAANRAARVKTPLAVTAGHTGLLAARAISQRLRFDGANTFNAAPAATAEELLRQTSFSLAHSNSGLNFWASGGYLSAEGNDNGITYNGDTTALHLGADTARNNGLLGIAITRSAGDMAFNNTDNLETQVTSVHPYLTRRFNRFQLWTTLGHGSGNAELKEPDVTIKTDLTLTTAALGVTFAPAAGVKLAADGTYTRAQLDAAESAGRRLPKVTANTLRINAAAELSRQRDAWRPFLTANLRHDSGDGDTGTAGDLGGGVEWQSPTVNLRLEGAKYLTGSGSEEERLNFTAGKTTGRLNLGLTIGMEDGIDTDNLLHGEWRF